MKPNRHSISLSALALLLAISATPLSFAQDAMAPAADAMAPQAMTSGDDLQMCLDQVGMITFPTVMQAAADACHSALGGNAMAPDAMAPADAMAPVAQ